jgi:hypothetical protein
MNLKNEPMQRILISITLILLFNTVNAQTADSTVKRSPVRTLTYAEYQALLNGGAGEDMGLVAKMNHYPMPDIALKWRNELDLSPIQIKKITEIDTYMHRRRLQAGGSIISNEKTLDSLFRTHRMDDGTLIFFTNRSGAYLGELKNAILQACLSTQKLLSPQQIAKLESLQKPD